MRAPNEMVGTMWEGRSGAPSATRHLRYATNEPSGVGMRFYPGVFHNAHNEWEYLKGGLGCTDGRLPASQPTPSPAQDSGKGLGYTRFHVGFMRRQADEPFRQRFNKEQQRDASSAQHAGLRRQNLTGLTAHTPIFEPVQLAQSDGALSTGRSSQMSNVSARIAAAQTMGGAGENKRAMLLNSGRFDLGQTEGLMIKNAASVADNFKYMHGYTVHG